MEQMLWYVVWAQPFVMWLPPQPDARNLLFYPQFKKYLNTKICGIFPILSKTFPICYFTIFVFSTFHGLYSRLFQPGWIYIYCSFFLHLFISIKIWIFIYLEFTHWNNTITIFIQFFYNNTFSVLGIAWTSPKGCPTSSKLQTSLPVSLQPPHSSTGFIQLPQQQGIRTHNHPGQSDEPLLTVRTRRPPIHPHSF